MRRCIDRRIIGRALLAVMVCLPAGFFLGCSTFGLPPATNDSPLPQRYDATGVAHSFKRVEQHAERDYIHHFFRKAYSKPGAKFAEPTEGDMVPVIKQWGRPDWIRQPFRSLQNERVQEWLYLSHQRVFQFVGERLVFDGPLTDYEQILLSKGYPDRVETNYGDTGTNDDIFVYSRVYFPLLEEFHFVNGTLVQWKEGN